MTRNRIFISYSHRDKDYLDELLKYLQHWQDGGVLDIWSDQELEASQKWEQEIQQAIDSACVAVLLISQDFLNSAFIRERELPPLLQAREQEKLALACLYIRPSHVDDPDCIFPDGQGAKVKLTRYQALNPLSEPVIKYENDNYTREQLYLRATRQIRNLASKFGGELHTKSLPDPERCPYELTVCLEPRSNKLIRTYSVPGWPRFRQDDTGLSWREFQKNILSDLQLSQQVNELSQLGPMLFDLLFISPDSDSRKRVLQEAFAAEEEQTPIRQPLRVRIQIDNPLLAQLPWSQTSWKDALLQEAGWTFELALPAHGPEPPDYANVTLFTPCEVLMIAPETATERLCGEAHHLGLQHLFTSKWPDYPHRSLIAKNRQEITKALQKRPRIVYYYGPASVNDRGLELRLQNDPGDAGSLTLKELGKLWHQQPPRVLFLNLIGESPWQREWMAAEIVSQVPFVAIQTTTGDTLEARMAAIRWFAALLDGADPVWALHAYGLPNAVAWTNYQDWITRTTTQLAGEDLIELLLDRHIQRGLVSNFVNDLVQDRDRRLCAILAYGEKGNLVARFSGQVIMHLKRNTKEVANLIAMPLDLTGRPNVADKGNLERQLKQLFNLGPRNRVIDGLKQYAPLRIGKALPVLLLDWKLPKTEDTVTILRQIESWLAFCSDELARYCPGDLRLLCYLGLEIPKERHDALEKAMNNILAQERFADWAFEFQLLPRLDHITQQDLVHFFRDRQHCNCPDSMRPKLPRLIYQDTQGEFAKTVERLRQGAQTYWEDLYTELAEKFGGGETDAGNNV